MDLFVMHAYAPGMPMFQPNGTVIYRRLDGFVRGCCTSTTTGRS